MFEIFKKKVPIAEKIDFSLGKLLLSYSDQNFVSEVARIITGLTPNECAMTVVAYENQGPMMKVASKLVDKGSSYPTSIEEYILFFEREMKANSNNEAVKRRFGWFLFSALVRRANALTRDGQRYPNDLAKIWLALANGCRLLPDILQTVVIWSEKEKLWFAHLLGAKDSIEYCLNHIAPK
jgi:hypothetical protein